MSASKITLKFSGLNSGGNIYTVHRGKETLGSVYRRDGGWWGWSGGAAGSQWCRTRSEAVKALVAHVGGAA